MQRIMTVLFVAAVLAAAGYQAARMAFAADQSGQTDDVNVACPCI